MGVLFGRQQPVAESRDWSPVDSRGFDTFGGDATRVPSLRFVPLYAATRLIADQVASAPLRAYYPRADGAREALATQPALIRAASFEWKHRAMTSMLLWGNAYGLITSRDANGTPTNVVWLAPDRVQCVGDGASPAEFSFNGRPLPLRDVVHIPAYTVPGQSAGVSPLGAFRLTIETGRSAQQYARDWYDGGGIPAAVLRNEAVTLDAEVADRVKARAKASLTNGDIFVTGKDWSYTPVGAPAADMRFIETMKLTATQVAAIYGVPPEEIGGEVGSSLTYATLEQNALKLATQTVRPWAVRFEDALSNLYAGRTYARFNLDAGVRADMKSRYEAHEIALRTGLETLGEGRALEERPPLTEEQITQWQAWYAAKQKGAADASA